MAQAAMPKSMRKETGILLQGVTRETVAARHSVRDYTDRPLDGEPRARLSRLVGACNADGGLHIQLVTDEPDAYGKSFFAHYGKFHGVRNYLCLVGPRGGGTEERLGYYGEILVLRAQALGLNTCWCGLSYSRRHTVCEVGVGEKLHALIALGYGAAQGVPHRSKTPAQVAEGWDDAPAWFKEGVACALLAPTALNQQKFRFACRPDGRVEATTSWGFYCKMDLGIAKLHFEIGAGAHPFTWT